MVFLLRFYLLVTAFACRLLLLLLLLFAAAVAITVIIDNITTFYYLLLPHDTVANETPPIKQIGGIILYISSDSCW